MTTPLTPEEEQRIREWVAEDKRRGAINSLASHGTASGLTVDALLATLDRERRERVDLDLRAWVQGEMEKAEKNANDWLTTVPPNYERSDRAAARVAAYRAVLDRLAATPDHTVVGEEREAEIDVERLARAAANESDSATEDERRNGDLWSLLSERIRDDWRRKAHRIAAEYRATPRPR